MKPIPTIHAPTIPILAPQARDAASDLQSAVASFLAVVTQAIDSGTAELAPMSPIATHAAKLRKAGDPSPLALIRVVESEPAVAGQVIRLASTAFYGQPGASATSLKTACGQVGPRTLLNLIETAARSEFLRQGRDGAFHLLRKIWTNTLYTAYAAREIARWGGEVDPEEALLAGLFHRAGELLIVRFYTEHTPPEGSLHDGLMQTIIDEHQASVGERLLSSWSFPDAICQLAGGRAAGSTLGAIVCAARQSALLYGYSYLAARPDPAALREALKILRLDSSDFEDIPETIGPSLNEALSITR